MISRRLRFLLRHGRGLFVWAVIIIAGVQLWLVPFGVGASATHPSQTTTVSATTESSGWTSPTTMAELHQHLHSMRQHH